MYNDIVRSATVQASVCRLIAFATLCNILMFLALIAAGVDLCFGVNVNYRFWYIYVENSYT